MQMPLGSQQLSRGKQVSVSSAVISVCSSSVWAEEKTHLKPYMQGVRDGWVGIGREPRVGSTDMSFLERSIF